MPVMLVTELTVGKATHLPKAAATTKYLRLRMEHSFENAPLIANKRFGDAIYFTQVEI
jgi:hypothetical protein